MLLLVNLSKLSYSFYLYMLSFQSNYRYITLTKCFRLMSVYIIYKTNFKCLPQSKKFYFIGNDC